MENRSPPGPGDTSARDGLSIVRVEPLRRPTSTGMVIFHFSLIVASASGVVCCVFDRLPLVALM